MAIQPLEQRLNSILPAGPTPIGEPPEMPLEPMPADVQEPATEDPTAEPGSPSMEGVQVAGLADAAIRRLVTKQATKAERNLVPEAARAAEGTLPEAAKAGRFKVIPEADQKLTDTVTQAVQARRAAEPNIGKPSPTADEARAGVPVEPFNLSRYQTEDAAAIVGGVADALNIKTKAVTFAEIKAKATENGISESFLTRLIGTDGKMMANAVETYKALEVLESSANELDRLFKKVASADATDGDKLQLRQQIALHGMIQKGVKGMQTETARALAVFRIPRDSNSQLIRQVLDEYGGDKALSDLAKSYLNLESRAAQNQLIEKSMMSGLKDVWFSTYINGLLSSPVSQVRNLVGSFAFGAYQIPERMIASFYSNLLPDAVRGGKLPSGLRSWGDLVPGSAEEKIAFDEALTLVQSLRNGMTEGLQLASKAWKNNAPSDLMTKIETLRTPQENLGTSLQTMTGQTPDTWLGKALGYYGTAIELPGRAMMTTDEFFKGTFYRMELNAQIIRRSKKVYRDGVEAGMSETDALAKSLLEAESLHANPPRDLDEAAMEFARKGTFTAELPPALKTLQNLFDHPVLKVVVPFFKTPANIGLQLIERTPFAPLSSQWREEVAKGGIYRDMALAKVTLGTSMIATFAAIAAEGQITGSGPSRKEHREALLRDGWQPYSIKIGDTYYSYAGLEPISAFLAIAADYAEYAKYEPDKSKIEQVFMGAAYGMYEYLKEQPYLQGLAEVAKTLGLGRSGSEFDGKKAVDNLTKQLGGFVIGGSPAGAYNSMIANIERIYDPTAKDTRASPDLPMGVRGFVEAFTRYRSRLPAYNNDIPDSLNLWGDPILQGRGKPYEIVLPTRVSPAQFSMVDDALQRIGGPIGMPASKEAFTVGDVTQPVELSAAQRNRLLTIYGKELPSKDGLMEVFNTPGFDLMSLGDQQLSVQRVHSRFMKEAKRRLAEEDPDIQAKVLELHELRKANGLYYKP